MCGRFAVTTDPALLAESLGALNEIRSDACAGAGAPDYNVAPTAAIAALVARHPHGTESAAPVATRRLRSMRWGLVPPWAKARADGTPQSARLLINARAETVTSSPAFRASATSRRCLVPMDGWYEWRAEPPTAVRGRATRAAKTPFYFHRADDRPLLIAGLWSVWKPEAGAAPLLSCTVITTDAVGAAAEVHDRMPLPIAEAHWDRWLDPDRPADPALLAAPPEVADIAVREVSTLVNNVANNGPELIAPAGPAPGQLTLL
ncbi:MAG TPA: SOS response-associated peptidase [Mycolicibacillus parakoreensis]|nr:SOS response-associated peptidase [Mycolicibacillus parakoreensis]